MSPANVFFITVAMVVASLAHAQDTLPKPDAPAKMPPSPEGIAPVDPGIVATPPATATESKTIRVPSRKIDPAITKPTGKIDQQNQQKLRDKQEAK